jgi:putative ABC transport system permease protein
MQRWTEDRRGAIVGDLLAKKKGWKIGDTVTLTGTIFPGDWQFRISGVYIPKTKMVDRRSLLFHWEYLNEGVKMERMKDKVGWVVSRVADPSHAVDVAAAIDKHFDDADTQTISQDERAFGNSFLGMFSAVLTALDVVSIVILAIMGLILGNTIAMGVRERTKEYGVMRAIGFLPRHVAILVVIEGAVLGLIGGGMGLLAAFPFVEKGMGRFIEENMAQYFPIFRIPSGVAFAALGLAVAMAISASLRPAYHAWKIDIINALRRVG